MIFLVSLREYKYASSTADYKNLLGGRKEQKNLTLKTRKHKTKQTKMTKTNPFPNFRSPGR